MPKTSTKGYYLNRYTSLPFLIDILCNKKLTLVDPSRWEDENDSYFMELYKTKSGYESLLALCFAEYDYSTTEKYHLENIRGKLQRHMYSVFQRKINFMH